MDELTLDNKKYLSSKRAAKVTGYAKDYVGQLCREGRIEARLVGRNWYVLESSILAHRFGPEAEEKSPEPVQTPDSVWEAPRYIAETSPSIPPIAEKPPKEPEMQAAASVSEDPREVLENMQSAWKEWFEQQEQALPDASGMLLADHEEAPPVPEPASPAMEPMEEPVPLEKKQEPEDKTEEIQLHIERTPARPVVRPVRTETIFDLRAARSAGAPVHTANLGTRSAHPPYRPAQNPVSTNNFAARAVFVALSVIAVAIALVGSGFLDQTLASSRTRGPLTDFFSGTTDVSK